MYISIYIYINIHIYIHRYKHLYNHTHITIVFSSWRLPWSFRHWPHRAPGLATGLHAGHGHKDEVEDAALFLRPQW